MIKAYRNLKARPFLILYLRQWTPFKMCFSPFKIKVWSRAQMGSRCVSLLECSGPSVHRSSVNWRSDGRSDTGVPCLYMRSAGCLQPVFVRSITVVFSTPSAMCYILPNHITCPYLIFPWLNLNQINCECVSNKRKCL